MKVITTVALGMISLNNHVPITSFVVTGFVVGDGANWQPLNTISSIAAHICRSGGLRFIKRYFTFALKNFAAFPTNSVGSLAKP